MVSFIPNDRMCVVGFSVFFFSIVSQTYSIKPLHFTLYRNNVRFNHLCRTIDFGGALKSSTCQKQFRSTLLRRETTLRYTSFISRNLLSGSKQINHFLSKWSPSLHRSTRSYYSQRLPYIESVLGFLKCNKLEEKIGLWKYATTGVQYVKNLLKVSIAATFSRHSIFGKVLNETSTVEEFRNILKEGFHIGDLSVKGCIKQNEFRFNTEALFKAHSLLQNYMIARNAIVFEKDLDPSDDNNNSSLTKNSETKETVEEKVFWINDFSAKNTKKAEVTAFYVSSDNIRCRLPSYCYPLSAVRKLTQIEMELIDNVICSLVNKVYEKGSADFQIDFEPTFNITALMENINNILPLNYYVSERPQVNDVWEIDQFRKLLFPRKLNERSLYDYVLFRLYIIVNQLIDVSLHSVIRLLFGRYFNGVENDLGKLALAIEGGGMRGAVAAGMTIGLNFLNVSKYFDCVYGSSAGALVGAYLVSNQLPYSGARLYSFDLPNAGKKFIDPIRLLRSAGFFDFDFVSLFRDRLGKPVLNLDYLLDVLFNGSKCFDWETFCQNDKKQPLNIIASGICSGKSVVLASRFGNFQTARDFSECLKASMLLPGMSGPLVRLKNCGINIKKVFGPDFEGPGIQRFHPVQYSVRGEPMADAMLFEPIPYRSAISEGASHILVLRTRPDGVPIRFGGVRQILDRLIVKRYFKHIFNFPSIFTHMDTLKHRQIYLEDILRLNRCTNFRDKININDLRTMETANNDTDNSTDSNNTSADVFAVALHSADSKEVPKVTTNKELVYEVIKKSFVHIIYQLYPFPISRDTATFITDQVFPGTVEELSKLNGTYPVHLKVPKNPVPLTVKGVLDYLVKTNRSFVLKDNKD